MANYAHIEDGRITGVYDLYPDNWRNISNFYLLENDTDTLRSLGWRTIVKTIPTYNSDTQYVGNPIHVIEDDNVIETYEIVDIVFPEIVYQTEEELAAIKLSQHNSAMETLRNKRDKLLAETDVTQLVDVIALNGIELNQLFVVYRQALRDLPSSYDVDSEFINESTVTYPTYPEVTTENTETVSEPVVQTPEVTTENTETVSEPVVQPSDGETSSPGDA
jgi:hypothetical protein